MKNKQLLALISLAMKITFSQLFIVILFLGNVYAKDTKGQDVLNKSVSISVKNVELKKVLVQLENLADVKFVYSSKAVSVDKPITIVAKKIMLSELLNKVLEPFNIKYKLIDGLILLYEDSLKIDLSIGETIKLLQNANNDTMHRISGTVVDQKGNALANASVVVVGTQKGTVTDAQGNFSLLIEDNNNASLEFSHIGYTSSIINVGAKNDFHIILNELANGMNEVIVVGYQSQKRSAINGAVTTVNVDNVSKVPIGFVDQALQGQASGVRVTQASGQPGDGVAVRIRGVGSINNNDPLYIIDGVPTQDGINFLAADDIASITVLKDAASASIYGSRSAGGVIVITTKNGKSGKTAINYSVYTGIQTHGYLTPMATASEYKTIYNEMVANDNAGLSPGNPLLKSPIPDSIPMANTNWLNSIFRVAPEQDHELSVSGGNEKTQYSVSGNLFKQDGIILNSWYNRYTLRTKLTSELTDKLKVGTTTSFSYYDKNSIGSSGDGLGGNGGSVVRYALFRDPAIPVYSSPGVYSDLPQYPGYFGDGYNPVGLANNTNNVEKQFRGFGDVFAEYKILHNLIFKSDFGGDVFLTQDKTFDMNWGTGGRINNPNTLSESQTTSENMVWNNTFRYNTTFNSLHHLNFLVGTEAVANTTFVTSESEQKFLSQIPSLEFFGRGDPKTAVISEGEMQWALMSFLGNVNYDYNNEFFASASARRDASSRFGPSNRWANFFSGAVGWNLMNEKWFTNIFPVISKMKLRASYGQLGNQNLTSNNPDYPWASVIGSSISPLPPFGPPISNYVLGSPQAVVQGMTVTSLGNTNVKWETETQTDVGLDIGILHDKLSLTVDYFDKVNSNILVAVPLPMIGGNAAPPYINDGSVQNQGFEFDLQYSNNDHKIKYSLSGNLATIQNKVVSLPVPIQSGRIDNGVYATLTTVGHPLGSFYGYQMIGIFQNANDIFTSAYQGPGVRPGDVKYKDINGDGKIDQNDRTFLGSAIPKFTYGFTGTLSYQNFDLFVLLQGSYGNKIYLQVNQDIEGFYRPFNVTQRVYDTRWHGEGTSNTMPLVSFLDQPNNIKEPSSRFLEDASYCRLKNLQIGYTIPKKLTNRLHIKGLRFYITGSNLVTITKYTGLDPEMHISNNVKTEQYPSDVAAGIDWGTYPYAKSYIIGANLNF
jgi:TonB-linked SusC/RagA family outer membrane protein